MDSDVVEMMHKTMSPEELPVAATMARYLEEKSQTFRELSTLRQKVCESKLYRDVYLHSLRVRIPPRAIVTFKIVEHNPMMQTNHGANGRASSR